jgi:hypothetical protein
MEEFLASSFNKAMRTPSIGAFRQARVWIGELPDAIYPPVDTLTHVVAAGRLPIRNGLTLATVEVFVPLGGRALYGLLGGRLKPTKGSHLSVQLSVSAPNEHSFPDSLAEKVDDVRVGLPAEYVQGVFDGIDLAKGELNTVAAGKLFIDCAAHGAIGSSSAIFKHLAAVLVKLFNIAQAESSDEELAKLFPSTFS